MTTHIRGRVQKFYEPLLVAAIIVVLAYTASYLIAVSPVLIRAIGPLLAT